MLRRDLHGKLYGGIAVGAKRNGGQETTLIYAMLDMINVGMLAVGNDSDTTSQYGGTVHAGDIGTAPKDKYGIDTSIGTGRRIANGRGRNEDAKDATLDDRPRMDFWLLQDKDGVGRAFVDRTIGTLSGRAETRCLDLTGGTIRPCIACDICPTHVGPDEEYRCIIIVATTKWCKVHNALLWPDIIVPTMYSPLNREGLDSVYQQFMERTRYLRRGDYVFTDRLVAPLVLDRNRLARKSRPAYDDVLRASPHGHRRPIIGYLHQGKLAERR